MMRLIWIDGRLSWPFVILVAYLSASMVVLDFCWRTLVMPFDTLMVYAALFCGAGAIVIVLLVLRHLRAQMNAIGVTGRLK